MWNVFQNWISKPFDVVWSYRDYRQAPFRYLNKVNHNCELLCRKELEAFYLSVMSWKLKAPRVRRILYADSSICEILHKQGIYELFDIVYEETFEELDRLCPHSTFFAAPKIWALTKLTKPSFVIDTETVLFSPLKTWLKPDRYYMSMRYEKSNPINYDNWSVESKNKFEILKEQIGSNGIYLDPKEMINAGYLFWKDPKVANIVGKKALDILDQVCSIELDFPEKWTFCEESILVPILRSVISRADTIEIGTAVNERCNFDILEFSSPDYSEAVYNFLKTSVEQSFGSELKFQYVNDKPLV